MQVFAELESEACAAEGLPSPPPDIFPMDGEDAAGHDDPMQMTWNPAHLGSATLPMDFSHDWAPIVTPAQRRSLDEAAAARARSGAAASTSGSDVDAAAVVGLEGALRTGLTLRARGDEEGPRSPMSSGSYGEMPVALAEQVSAGPGFAI